MRRIVNARTRDPGNALSSVALGFRSRDAVLLKPICKFLQQEARIVSLLKLFAPQLIGWLQALISTQN
jgi:hypothetical protein